MIMRKEQIMNQPSISSKITNLNIKDKVRWGKNVTFGPNCREISIGYGGFIGNDIYIDVEKLEIGDYCTIHHGSVLHGKSCTIGHNTWIGHYCIIDSLGGNVKIGNNVGIGAHSQLWSHMKFGDRLAGCRWYKMDSLDVGDDVWFVGHCIVAPIKAEPRSMLLVGGVASKNMKENHIYAGSPAKDVSEKMGYQFETPSMEEKRTIFYGYIDSYEKSLKDVFFIKIVDSFENINDSSFTYFNLETREYMPTYSDHECDFMRFLLYDRAKFIPVNRKD
jgi:acetyltransferase-like isoleucine patch superfamily enzyme